jgi:hypothetical protein
MTKIIQQLHIQFQWRCNRLNRLFHASTKRSKILKKFHTTALSASPRSFKARIMVNIDVDYGIGFFRRLQNILVRNAQEKRFVLSNNIIVIRVAYCLLIRSFQDRPYGSATEET